MNAALNIPLVDLHAQYESIKSEIDSAISQVIKESGYIKSRFVGEFEKSFAALLGINHCIGCANGTDAIEVVLRALGVGQGDEVIVPAHTWISTSEAVTSVGAKVVFADTTSDYFTINPVDVQKKITSKTKAIIPVHLYGHPAPMNKIMEIAKQHKLFVIEDCAQAHLAEFQGKKIGTFGDAATFSFFPGKNLGAYGDAGGIVTNNEELSTLCRRICDHGRAGKHDHSLEGRNSRLDGLQAAILNAKAPHLHKWTELRRSNAKKFNQALSGLSLVLPKEDAECKHVYHLYVIQVENREAVSEKLLQKGIHTGVHYPRALPNLTAYSYLNHSPSDFPVATEVTSKILSLPLYPELSDKQIDYIAQSLKSIL